MTETSGRLSKDNNFNLIRLVLAALVLLSHSYEIVDGNRQREPLTRLFGTVSFGELAVDGFFIISGLLISRSWLHRSSGRQFMQSRILRIYPAFIVASLFCIVLVGPLASADVVGFWRELDAIRAALGIAVLRGPVMPPVFPGSNYPYINNSLWTIKFEFMCYLVTALVGIVAGRRRFFIVWLLILTLSAAVVALDLLWPRGGIAHWLAGAPADLLISGARLLMFFAVGVLFPSAWIVRQAPTRVVMVAVAFLAFAMFGRVTAEFGLAAFGSFLLLRLAFSRGEFLSRLQPPLDISYGLYLYGWPIQKLLLLYWPGLDALPLFLLALVASAGAGYLSWIWIERPALQWGRNARPAAASPA